MDGNEMVRQPRQLADLRAQGTLTPKELVAALLCACLIVVVYLVVRGVVQNALPSSGGSALGVSASDLLGAGFWFALIGAVGAAISAVYQICYLVGGQP